MSQPVFVLVFTLRNPYPLAEGMLLPQIKATCSFHKIFRARVHSGITVCAADNLDLEHYNFLFDMTLVTLFWK